MSTPDSAVFIGPEPSPPICWTCERPIAEGTGRNKNGWLVHELCPIPSLDIPISAACAYSTLSDSGLTLHCPSTETETVEMADGGTVQLCARHRSWAASLGGRKENRRE